MTMREEGNSRRWLQGAIGAVTLWALSMGDAGAVDFLRGDANSDGEVSISDAYFSFAFFFSEGTVPECGDAGDANGDGRFNIADGVNILNFVSGRGKALRCHFRIRARIQDPPSTPRTATPTEAEVRRKIRPRLSRSFRR